MGKIFLFFLTLGISGERQFYFGQNQSLFEWKIIDPSKFLNYGKWERELKYKEDNPNWEILIKDRKLREGLGRALACIGNCILYRGKAFNKIQFKSQLIEGDEVVTGESSYAWLFLLDGTMVRLSPHSSISLREINVGLDGIFFHARINYGNILWLSRDSRNFKVDNDPDSDTLFIPLKLPEANPQKEYKSYDEENLYSLTQRSRVWERHVKYLNRLLDENNLYLQNKPTYSFLILPNITLTGFNLSAEFYVLNSGIAFFKKRDASQLNLVEDDEVSLDLESLVYLREATPKSGNGIEAGRWYKVAEDGKSFEPADNQDTISFWPAETLTQKISTVLVARELLLREYSTFMYKDLRDPQLFAKTYGYRLWNRIDPIYGSDLYKRIEFLKDYTKREEKIIYLLKKKLYETGREKLAKDLGEEYYNRALMHHYMKRELNEDEFQKILFDFSE